MNQILKDYPCFTDKAADYPKQNELQYLFLGVLSELGGLSDLLRKWINDEENIIPDDRTFNQLRSCFITEVGDVMWYLCRLSKMYCVEDDFIKEVVSLSNVENIENEELSEIDLKYFCKDKIYEKIIESSIKLSSLNLISYNFIYHKSNVSCDGNQPQRIEEFCNNLRPFLKMMQEVAQCLEFDLTTSIIDNYHKLNYNLITDKIKLN